jgi:hypothetical protein
MRRLRSREFNSKQKLSAKKKSNQIFNLFSNDFDFAFEKLNESMKHLVNLRLVNQLI